MAQAAWLPEHDDELRRRHAAGESLHSISATMGRAKTTVYRRSKAIGLLWDRAGVEPAIRARVIDAKARRADLQIKLLEDAERLRAELWKPVEYIDHGGRDYVEVRWTQPAPHFADKQRIMQSVGIAVDRSLKLALYDSDATGHVQSLLSGLADQLGLSQDDTKPS